MESRVLVDAIVAAHRSDRKEGWMKESRDMRGGFPPGGSQVAGSARRFPTLVWLGPLLVLVGSISYFLVFVRVPTLRDVPWANLPLVWVGLGMSAIGLRRTLGPTRPWRGKILGVGGFALSLIVTLLFHAYVFYYSYQLPPPNDAAQLGQQAPDFALPNQDGSTVRRSDFQGQKVVLVFYRGHW
jgi:hypothetical protein